MQWTEIPSGQTHRAFSIFMLSLGDRAGLVVARLNTEQAFANRLALLCHNNAFEPSTSHQAARRIMGQNIFGIEEAIKYYGIIPSKRQLAYMAEVPYSEATLTACKETHVLAAVFRLSGVEIREKVKSKKVFYKQDWYDTQLFANDKGVFEWHFVRKTPVEDSTRKMWNEQQPLLGETDEVPKFQVMVYAIVGHFLATGERLFDGVYVRCADFDSDGNRAVLGFSPVGLGVVNGSVDGRDGDIGLSSSRKQES